MATPVGSIISRALRDEKDKVNCISFPTHERYQSYLANTNARYYLIHGTPGVKENGWISSYAPQPRNTILLPKSQNPLETLPPDIDFHCIISQHRFGQFQTAHQISKLLHIPHINIEHTLFMPFWPSDRKTEFKKLKADINLFISPQSRDAWGWGADEADVILHGVDTNLFKPMPTVQKKYDVISVVNDWANRGDILGFDIWQRVVQNNFKWLVRGDTKGLSTPPNNLFELVTNYNEAKVFFNTSRYSPVPSVMLEAMACGIPVVTTDNCLITDIIVDGFNGFKTNDENNMREKIQFLLDHPATAKEIGKNARDTILEKFPLDKFVDNWNEILYKAANMHYDWRK